MARRRKPPVDQIVQADCVAELARMPDECFDMCFADPPYNLQLQGELHRPDRSRVNGVEDTWDQFDSMSAYDEFTAAWMSEVKRALKPNGTLWVIGTYHNIYRVGKVLQDLGFWILNDVTWVKKNPMPNFRGVRFTNATESLIWAVRDQERKDYTFNYALMKERNEGKQMRSDWRFNLCTGNERIKDCDGQKVHSTQKPEALDRGRVQETRATLRWDRD